MFPRRAPGQWVRPAPGAAIGRHNGESSQEETGCAVAMSPGRSLEQHDARAPGRPPSPDGRNSAAWVPPAGRTALRCRFSGMADIEAHITGTVWKIECKVGDTIAEGDTVVILESMKMEMPVEAEDEGTVKEILCEEGQAVNEGDTLVVLE